LDDGVLSRRHIWGAGRAKARSWRSLRVCSSLAGADLGWAPVKNLSFDREGLFQTTVQAQPTAFVGANRGIANTSGFVSRLRVQRNFRAECLLQPESDTDATCLPKG
jgi:hypothetical protein